MCLVIFFMMIASGVWLLPNANAQVPWQSENYGTYAGAINSIVVTPTGRMIAGTVWDGFFISDDDGISWIASNEGFTGFENTLPTLVVIGTKIFAGTRTGLFVSIDDGNTWSSSGISDVRVRNLIESGSNIVLTTTNNNTFYSNDNGVNWLPTLGISNEPIATFTHLGTSLFATGDNKVFISDDNGESWTESTPITSNSIATYDIISVGSTLISATNIGIFRSTDAGSSWALSDASKQYGIMEAVNGDIFLGTETDIYKSSDEGLTWTLLFSGINNAAVMQFAVSNGNIFVAVAKAGLLFSNDNGLIWSNRDFGLVNPHINSLAAKEETFIAATNKGLFISSDDTKTWKPILTAPPLRYTSIVVVENKFVAGTDTNGIYISEDDGLNWASANVGLTELSVRTLSYIGDKIWCGTQSGLFYSDDLGVTWTSTSVWGIISAIVGKDNFIYVRSQGMRISSDGGLTWVNSINAPFNFGSGPVNMTLLGNKIYYADQQFGKIYVTTLGSSTWTLYKNTDGIGLTNDGVNLYYGPSIDQIISFSGLATISLGYPNHLLFDRARFILPFNSRLYVCFNSNLNTGAESGVIYSTSIEGIPGISQFSPTAGKVGQTMTITGNNLIGSPKRVFFNDLEGTVLTSSSTSWTVSIPPIGGEVTIKVVVGNLESTLQNKFKIIPEFKSISPKEATAGTRIVIEGSGMDTNVRYQVKYGIPAQIAYEGKPSSSTTLVTYVPDIEYRGPLTLNAFYSEDISTTEDEFIVLPRITDFSPKQAETGELILVHGSGFSIVPGNNRVAFNGVNATIKENYKNVLLVTLPTGETSGTISVTTNDRTALSEQPFVALPLSTDCSWGPAQPHITQVGLYQSTFPILESSSEYGNRWYFNGELVNSDFGKYYLATENGTYTVLTTVDGCNSALSESYQVSILITGIGKEEIENTFDIYPNPFEHELAIDLRSIPFNEMVSITIINQLGIPVYRSTESGGQLERVNVSHFSPGLYFMKVESTSLYMEKKLIKE